MPEFAFVGRSNVGKSTLINGLMNRKSLARTSSKPGKTQTINFYKIVLAKADGAFFLVDLPGYGYTTAGPAIKAQWGRMVSNYLGDAGRLRAIFLLLDIRHKPSADDMQMYEWIIDSGHTPIIIATKADKIKKSQLAKQLKLLRDTLTLAPEASVIPYSSQTKEGLGEIIERIQYE